MENAIRAMVCITVLASAMGCGDDDDGAGASSGVSQSKELLSLSDSEVKKVCEWVKDKTAEAEGTPKQSCTVEAVLSSETSTECKEAVDTCIAEFDDDGEEDCDDFEIEDEVGGDCKATVQDLENCLNALMPIQKKALASASCSNLEADLYSDFPSSCEKLETKCPGFFEE